MAGRKTITYVFPLDFEEFLDFKNEKKPVIIKGKNLEKQYSKYFGLLKEFMIFGGYPEVVLTKDEKEKTQILEDIFDLFVKKDLVEYLKTEKILPVKKLIEHLAINNGGKVKIEEITALCSLNFKEIKNYIEILKENHLIHIHRPFYSNKNKELVKIPKIYFIDNGVRNYFIHNTIA